VPFVLRHKLLPYRERLLELLRCLVIQPHLLRQLCSFVRRAREFIPVPRAPTEHLESLVDQFSKYGVSATRVYRVGNGLLCFGEVLETEVVVC
jgi:hypothetical protein